MITVRDIKFNLTDETSPHWCNDYEFSVLANAIFILLPWLEPYFIHNVREAAKTIDGAQLNDDAKAFIGQEVRHAQQHRRYNQILARRYPELPAREERIRLRLDASRRKDPLSTRLAYTAGFEALTFHFLAYLFSRPERWFAGADPNVLAMFAWHAAEEIEHKTVAFDVLQRVDEGYVTRVRGFASAVSETLSDIFSLAWYMMKVDERTDRHSVRRMGKLLLTWSREFPPTMRPYLGRGYRPEHHPDPPSLIRWVAQHRAGMDLRTLSASALNAMARLEGPPGRAGSAHVAN
ncbi:metal-dependent hydrolase [Pendulispora albinea]|uniref:Metal-dependent hydrolase n=1 Tax=Pendulispora albinea TaxID=2741071 RepID=A0ABZ2M9J9_9BACT